MIHPLLLVILVQSVKNIIIFLHGLSWLCCPEYWYYHTAMSAAMELNNCL